MPRREFGGTRAAFHALVHPDDLDQVMSTLARAQETREPCEIEYRIVRPDGAIREVHEIGETIYDDAGNPMRISGAIQDITERKRADEALRQSELRLAEAQRLAQVGNWQMDLASGENLWSDQAYEILGYEPQAMVPTYDSFIDRVHPDDRDRVLHAGQSRRATGKPHAIEFRIVQPDGRQLDVEHRCQVGYGNDGTISSLLAQLAAGEQRIAQEIPLRRHDGVVIEVRTITIVPDAFQENWKHLITTDEDITKRRRAEETSAISEARLRDS